MTKTRYSIVINWQGEPHTFYRHASSASQALRHAIQELSRKVGYEARYVRDFVMDSSHQRYEVKAG
jgi:hypothetical protein